MGGGSTERDADMGDGAVGGGMLCSENGGNNVDAPRTTSRTELGSAKASRMNSGALRCSMFRK